MIRKERLPNGLTLITERMANVRSVSIGVWLRRGSRHEPPQLNGISHFIEHLVFKGTASRTAHEVALAMDRIGGQMDAFTTKEYTCFYARVLDEHLPTAVELLSDIVLHPKFDPHEVERERRVVLEEIRMVEDTPDELLYDLFAQHFYRRHPLGRPIQGTVRSLRALSRERLLRFFRRVYRPENMLIAAAGHVSHSRVAELVRRGFGALRPGRNAEPRTRPPRPHFGVVRKKKDQLEQLHLLLAVPAFPESFEGRYTLYTLNAILGGSMSSRLFQKIREQRGLAYSVYSAFNGFMDCGFLMVYAATHPARGAEVVDLVLGELEALRDEGPTAQELEVAKEHLKGSLMLSLESTSSRMSSLARQEIYFGRQFGPQEILRGIERVRREDVRALSRQLFQGQRVSLAAVGRLDHFRVPRARLTL